MCSFEILNQQVVFHNRCVGIPNFFNDVLVWIKVRSALKQQPEEPSAAVLKHSNNQNSDYKGHLVSESFRTRSHEVSGNFVIVILKQSLTVHTVSSPCSIYPSRRNVGIRPETASRVMSCAQ